VRHGGIISTLLVAGAAVLSSSLVSGPANRDETARLGQFERSIAMPADGDGAVLRGAEAWLEAVGRGLRR
jgi:regulator of protease activity HflC (stomatin/prohibitin superfamily)